MSSTAICVENISKRYRIRVADARPDSVRALLNSVARSPFKYLRSTLRPPTADEILWALRDVSFSIRPGETVGIIGRNGAGKSTLLKLLSRITEPTSGRAVLHGRVGSLLEVGTGFHPELTGRENIYLKGAILGMHRLEIDRKLDEIVDFSEIERFIDTPVKRYSSGMSVRLAFSVAAHLDSEIMIMDEVLAVGDASFRPKSLDKMTALANDGRTVLFVSHGLASVRRLCQRALWLADGQLSGDGLVDDVVQAYLAQLGDSSNDLPPVDGANASRELEAEVMPLRTNPASGLVVRHVTFRNNQGITTSQFQSGDLLTIEMAYTASQPILGPFVWITVDGTRGPCFSANMLLDGFRPAVLEGAGILTCTFPSLPLLPHQGYVVRLAMRSNDGTTAIIEPQEVGFIRIEGDLGQHGFESPVLEDVVGHSVPVLIPYEWRLPDGRTRSFELGRPCQNKSV